MSRRQSSSLGGGLGCLLAPVILILVIAFSPYILAVGLVIFFIAGVAGWFGDVIHNMGQR